MYIVEISPRLQLDIAPARGRRGSLASSPRYIEYKYARWLPRTLNLYETGIPTQSPVSDCQPRFYPLVLELVPVAGTLFTWHSIPVVKVLLEANVGGLQWVVFRNLFTRRISTCSLPGGVEIKISLIPGCCDRKDVEESEHGGHAIRYTYVPR